MQFIVWTISGSRLLDTLIGFLKVYLKKNQFYNNLQMMKNRAKLPSMQRIEVTIFNQTFDKLNILIKYFKYEKSRALN